MHMIGSFSLIIGLFAILIFFLVIGIILFVIVKGLITYSKNSGSPILAVSCFLVDKRMNQSNTYDSNTMMHTTTTSYYVTFQLESGDRLEFWVNGNEYGLLIQGDRGRLTFQGTRYLGFQRDSMNENQ